MAESVSPHKEIARELFLQGYNCAQAVFAAFCDVTGMDFETALRLSSPMGGGMGRLREVCGACSACFMAAGMLYGYIEPANDTVKGAHYARIQELAHRFEARHGTIICRELLAGLQVDNSPVPTPRTREYYAKRPCLRFVETAAEILDEMIAERSAAKQA